MVMKNRNIILIVTAVIIFILSLLYIIYNNGNSDNIGNVSTDNQNEVIENESEYIINPPIPEGFQKVETDTASWELENGIPRGWNDGLVIEDINGNQFVWIPCAVDGRITSVPFFSLYKQTSEGELSTTSKLVAHRALDEETYFQDDEKAINNIKTSIDKYGGFYVGRYETGIEGGTLIDTDYSIPTTDVKFKKWQNGTAVIKQNSNVWNHINFPDAESVAENFIKTDYASTDLMNGYCYDTIIKWLFNDFPDIINDYNEKHGNYLNTSVSEEIINSGSNNSYKLKNIYDISGNVREWTTENMYESGYYYYTLRGGYSIDKRI